MEETLKKVPKLRFKDENGEDFPAWEEKKLGEVGQFCSGLGFKDIYQGHREFPIDVYKVSDMNTAGNE